MLSDEIAKVEIDEKQLDQMKNLVVNAERINIKTGELMPQEMVKVVRTIIEKNAQ